MSSSAHPQGRTSPFKCVVVGDACVGKTCMVARLSGRKPSFEYEPTIVDNTVISAQYKGQHCRLEICDTAGQEEFANLRSMSYTSVDAFLLCFCLVNRDSFENLDAVWLPELEQHRGAARVVLVGTKLDLYRPNETRAKSVTRAEIEALRSRRGFQYVQCSSVSCEGVQEVIDRTLAVLHGAGDTDAANRRGGNRRPGKCGVL